MEIPAEIAGWWRVVETSQWTSDGLDILGSALLSLGTGGGDRLRMHALLAFVNAKPTKTGVSFTWVRLREGDSRSGWSPAGEDQDQGRRRERVRCGKSGGARDADPGSAELPRQVATVVSDA